MPINIANTRLFYTLSEVDCTTLLSSSKPQITGRHPVVSGDQFADAVDTLVNSISGDSRRTTKQERADQAQKARGMEPPFPFDRPNPKEVREAQKLLGTDMQAFLVAHYAAKGSFPARPLDESRTEFQMRVTAECAACDAKMWKAAILNCVICPIPYYITLAVAQDCEWHVGPGHISGTGIVICELRIHVEAWCQKSSEEKGQWYVVYPKCVYRGDDHVEVGRDGKLHLETIKYSRWRVRLGWASTRPRLGSSAVVSAISDAATSVSNTPTLSALGNDETHFNNNGLKPI